MRWRTFAIVYLVLQSVGAIGWWLAILLWPAAQRRLVPATLTTEQFKYFLPTDAALFIGAALVSAWAIWQRRHWAVMCIAVHMGAAWYAGLYAWAASSRTDSAWASSLLMLAPMLALPLILYRAARTQP
jgi:hypothetical protein